MGGRIRSEESPAEALDRELRSSISIGSSRAQVEEFLGHRDFTFGYDPRDKAIYAKSRDFDDGALVTFSLYCTFHFGDDSKLESIESDVIGTGP